MTTCPKCGKNIENDASFCPYCGSSIEEKPKNENQKPGYQQPRKTIRITRKAIILTVIFAIVAAVLAYVIVCESKISKAEALYAQGQYFKAYCEIDDNPLVNKDKLMRFKASYLASFHYENYLRSKQYALTSSNSISFKDYIRDCFRYLILTVRDNNHALENSEHTDFEKSEYQRFLDLAYDELKSVFGLSKEDADKMVEEIRNSNLDMDYIIWKWLNKNYF